MSEPSQTPSVEVTPVEAAGRPGKAMSFWDHLNELRGTLFRCALSFAIGAGVVCYYFDEFYWVLSWPLNSTLAKFPELEKQFHLVTTTPMDPFNLYLQVAIVGGVILSSPLILVFLGNFISPALTEKERRVVLPFVGIGLLLFLSGCAFSYFLLVTSALRVSIELGQSLNLGFNWTPGSYFSLLTWLVLGVGASFEFPLVIVVLVHFGLLTTAFLRKYRRHAIVVIFIIAAVVTPTPDPLTQALFAAPLYILFEVAIIAGAWIEKKRAARLAAG